MLNPTHSIIASSLIVAGCFQSATAAAVLIDFGITNNVANGSPTTSPDANGNYWNNVTSTTVATTISGGTGLTLNNLISTTNSPTGINLALSAVGWRSSGINNGGLNVAAPALGAFGVITATQDYFFVDNATASITISGLNPATSYNLGLFGTRVVDANRFTIYTVVDQLGTHTTTLQTSGINLGGPGLNGNNSTIAALDGLKPDLAGTLTLTVTNTGAGNNFGYLGIMQISEVPEPSAPLLISLGALGFFMTRRRSA